VAQARGLRRGRRRGGGLRGHLTCGKKPAGAPMLAKASAGTLPGCARPALDNARGPARWLETSGHSPICNPRIRGGNRPRGEFMRFDKLTTKFQQALADAQSMALAADHGFIEPVHLMAALLAQEDGGTA